MKKGMILKKGIALILGFALVLQMIPITADDGITRRETGKVAKYDVSEIIVKYKDNIDKKKIKDSLKNKTGLSKIKTKKEMKNEKYEVLDVGSTDNMEKTIKALGEEEGVVYAAPNYKIASYAYSDESLFAQQWGLKNFGQTINGKDGVVSDDINVVDAWDLADGDGVLVGILDTGMETDNPELTPNIYNNANEIPGNGIDDDNNGYIDDVNGWNFADDNAVIFTSALEDKHGTNVAGIIAARANGTGIVGVSPKVRILPMKFIKENTGYTSDVIEAIEYAKSMGVTIMNCSWGCSEYNFALKDAIENSNMLFVCAAGNDGIGKVSYPAAFGLPNMLSVGAMDNQGKVADYSNSGESQDVYAPGTDILTTDCGGGYTSVSGTSFSAAYVTGVAALVKDAVPGINASELRIAIRAGCTEKGDNKLKIPDATLTIKNALPLNFIKDVDGRLSRAMRYADKLITPAVAEVLSKETQWDALDTDQKDIIKTFFEVTDDEMAACQIASLDIIDSVIAILAAKRVNLPVSMVLSLLGTYNNDSKFDSELEGLKSLYDRIQLTDDEKNEIITLMQNNHQVIEIAKALIVSKTTSCPLSDVISATDMTYNFENLTYAGDEKDSFINLINTYNLDVQYMIDYLTAQVIVPSQLMDTVFLWQQENNFFIVENNVTPFTTTEPNLPGFNKYTVTNSGDWGYGNASIDKATGLLTYSQPLISIAGKNGLGLSLGMRFDSEVCDAVIAANETERISYAYMVTENDQYYTLDGTRCASMDTTNNYYYSNDSQIAAWQAIDQTEHHSSGYYYYLRIITITAKVNSSIEASGLNNYYDTSYNLGIGWAFDLPSIEKINTIKYIHLPGGMKYKISSTNKLEGFALNNLTFGTATGTDLTVNSIAAAYSLADLNGTKIFFDTNGRYIGTKDILGNKTQIYYDGNGMIDKIYDTSNRYLDINYTTAGNIRTVTITLVDNGTSPENILLYSINETYTTTMDGITLNKYLLTSITDERINRSTSFDYAAYDSYVHFNSRSSYGTPAQCNRINKAIYMNGVTSSTSAYIQYNYTTKHMAYGPASTVDYRRVSSIYAKPSKTDTNINNRKNEISYYYANDDAFWRFQANKIWPLLNSTANNYSLADDVKTVTQLNNQLRTCKQTTYQNSTGYALSQNEVVSVNSFGLPTEVKQKTFTFDPDCIGNENPTYSTSKYTISDMIYTWDTYGYGQKLTSLAKSGKCENNTVTMNSYDDQRSSATYNGISKTIPDSTSQYTTSLEGIPYMIKYVNTFDATTKKLHETTKKVYEMPAETLVKNLTYTHLDYNNDGNVSEVINKYATADDSLDLTTFANATTSDTVYAYDTKYGTYPVTTTVKNVLDCDGNSLKNAVGNTVTDITTNATYNMLGQTLSTTDGNGYTTGVAYNYSSANNTMQTITTYENGSTAQSTYYYANNYVTNVNPDGTGGKAVFDVYGNVTDTYRLNSNGTSYDLLSHTTYDNKMRTTSRIEYLNTTQTKYNTTTFTYDFLSRVTDTTVMDQSNNLVGQQGNSYAQGISKVSSVTNAVETTVEAGAGSDYSSTGYSDAMGRTQFTDTQNVDSSSTAVTYTDTNTYEAYNNLTNTTGDTVDKRDYQADVAGNDSKTDLGSNPNDVAVVYAKGYNGLGQQIHSTDPNSNISNIYYDILNRSVMVETPFDTYNSQLVYTKKKVYYDAGGRVVEEKQQNNELGAAEKFTSTKYTYDNMNRLIKTQQVINSTNSLYTQRYYDALGRLRRVYSGLSTALTINGLDSVTSNGDNDYSTTKYDYDFYGRLTSYTDGLDKSESYSYLDNTTNNDTDLTGRLNKKTLRNGNTFTYTYDSAGNMTQVAGTKSSITTTLSYTYDKTGNLLTASDGTNDISYEYDNMGRCVKETDDYNGTVYEKDYVFSDGKNNYMVYVYKIVGGIPQLDFAEDYKSWNNMLISVTVFSGTDYDPVAYPYKYSIDYYYDANGNLVEKYIETYGAASYNYSYNSSYLYNKANCITYADSYKNIINFDIPWSSDWSKIFEETAQYKLDGNESKKTTTRSSGTVEENSYSYDEMGRLTNELFKVNSSNKWQKSFTFDDYSNINTATYTDYVCSNNNTSTTYTHNKANQLTEQLIKHSGTTLYDYTFEYDDAGNLTTKKNSGTTQMTYTYDEMNRMDTSTSGSTTTTYAYDAMGQRISKQTGNKTTKSLWEHGSILEDFITTDSTTNRNIYIQGVSAEGVIKPYLDSNGKDAYENFYINAYNTNGDVAATWLINNVMIPSDYSFDAYGQKTGGGAMPSPYSYNGYYTDSETGFFYLNARYYDPTTQQFTQEDTYWGAGTNLYGYCGGNPVMYSDPTGHKATADDGTGCWVYVSTFTSSASHTTLRQGSRGDEVKELQRLLNQNGANLDPDGIFGPKTCAAVKRYQSLKGLAVDGIVGPITWGSLTTTYKNYNGGGSSKANEQKNNITPPTPVSTPTPTSTSTSNGGLPNTWIYPINGTASTKKTTKLSDGWVMDKIPGIVVSYECSITSSDIIINSSNEFAGFLYSSDMYLLSSYESSSNKAGIEYTFLSMYSIDISVAYFGVGVSISAGCGGNSVYISGTINLASTTSLSVGITQRYDSGTVVQHDFSINGDSKAAIILVMALLSCYGVGNLPQESMPSFKGAPAYVN